MTARPPHHQYGDNEVIMIIDGPGDVSAAFIASIAATLPLSFLAVALRFWSRRLAKAGYWWDDWLILVSLLPATIGAGIGIWWINAGAGRYIGEVTPAKLRTSFFIIFLTEIIYSACLCFVRASVLLLWQRLFDTRAVRWYCTFWGVISFLTFLASVIVSCLSCQPTHGFWDRFEPGVQCNVDLKKFYLSFAIAFILNDAAIIGLPLVRCWRLNLSRARRLLLFAIFCTGFFVTIISGVRIKAVWQADFDSKAMMNPTWTVVETGMWTAVEQDIAIVSACLPCLRPVLSRLVPDRWVPASLRNDGTVPYKVPRRYQIKTIDEEEEGDAGSDITLTANESWPMRKGSGSVAADRKGSRVGTLREAASVDSLLSGSTNTSRNPSISPAGPLDPVPWTSMLASEDPQTRRARAGGIHVEHTIQCKTETKNGAQMSMF